MSDTGPPNERRWALPTQENDPFSQPGIPAAAPQRSQTAPGLVPEWTNEPALPQPVPIPQAPSSPRAAAPSRPTAQTPPTATPNYSWTADGGGGSDALTALPGGQIAAQPGHPAAHAPRPTEHRFPVGLSCLAAAMSAWKIIGPIYLLAAGVLLSVFISEVSSASSDFIDPAQIDRITQWGTVVGIATIGLGLLGFFLLGGQVAGAVRQSTGMLSGFAGVLFAIDALWLVLFLYQTVTRNMSLFFLAPMAIAAVLQGSVFLWTLNVRRAHLQPWN